MQNRTKSPITNFRAGRTLSRSVSNFAPAQAQRRSCQLQFAAQTAKTIQGLERCGFALLDVWNLAQIVTGWYEGCTEAMFEGHHTAMACWLREQSDFAARNGMALEDLLQLLRACRGSAIELERWNEDVVSLVDEVINEGLHGLVGKVPWAIRADLRYQGGTRPHPHPPAPQPARAEAGDQAHPGHAAAPTAVAAPTAAASRAERRSVPRVRLQLPLRVAEVFGAFHEVTHTSNVSKSGLHFVARHAYPPQSMLRVVYPYWEGQETMAAEQAAEVVRLERLADGTRAISIRFLKPEAEKAKSKPAR